LHAILRGANLRRADLTGARLAGADLTGADLREVTGLTADMLNEACGDETTKLPTNTKLRSCTTITPPLPARTGPSK
ncbi:MAG TPA: pentapeptide repeat-containing protein, partial [Polyangiales bacterium]|nr:pentapeptide repeat-containing protein [Polyangiales bacterium]